MPIAQVSARPDADLRIRRAHRLDLDRLDGVECRAFTLDRFPRRNLRRLLASEAALFLIAESAGLAAGYALILFRKGSEVARLYSLAVDPDFRGKGVGDALLAAAGKEARRGGAGSLRLELRPSNRAAQRLYERAGFTILEHKPAYYDDGEDAIRMERSLAPERSGGRSAQP